MIKAVSKFGKRGAHINLPREWIGKKVKVELVEGLSYDKPKIKQIKPKVSYDNQQVKEFKEIIKAKVGLPEDFDEAEEDFIERYKACNPALKPSLEMRAIKQFLWEA